MSVEKTFEELLEEFLEKSRDMIGEEAYEHSRIPYGTPTPIISDVNMDYKNIRWFAHQLSDLNPLYIDPAYAAKSRYGCIIAPPSILSSVRYHSAHGAGPYGDYPAASMFSGTCFEWFDVIRLGTRFKTSKTLGEVFEKKGRRSGRLYFMIYDVYYWDFHNDLLAKSYGTMIWSPRRTVMARITGREEDRMGEQLLHTRGVYKYSRDELKKIEGGMLNEHRRGAQPRHWEDVTVGDKLETIVKGPWTVHDMIAYDIGHHSGAAFERRFRSQREEEKERGTQVRGNIVTGWPYGGGAGHEDAVICHRDGRFPLPYDYGGQRVTFPVHVVSNWMGDDGFIRMSYLQTREPALYGDVTWYTAEVVDKYKVTEKGEEEGVPGKEEYAAVDVYIKGVNQLGELSSPAVVTVYLPSYDLGSVKLPIPHPKKVPYRPFLDYYVKVRKRV
ncbi:MAG: MaoC family dehydratase N-terminal domain-containing protein [Candidatus Bathyarchaeota archaeon]|nr:MAG: MaoC family dehydratase N-terminal domain-containing protein [Candidatus Bathyarchaeota archaeon]